MARRSLTDDIVASFSAYGTDEVGQVKPDLVAPGVSLIGYLPDNNGAHHRAAASGGPCRRQLLQDVGHIDVGAHCQRGRGAALAG